MARERVRASYKKASTTRFYIGNHQDRRFHSKVVMDIGKDLLKTAK